MFKIICRWIVQIWLSQLNSGRNCTTVKMTERCKKCVTLASCLVNVLHAKFTNFIGGDNKRMGSNYQDVGGSQCKLEKLYISQKLVVILGDELNDLYIRLAECKPSSNSIERCFSTESNPHRYKEYIEATKSGETYILFIFF